MEHISIEGTPKTPTVNFDPVNGKIEIEGRCIPENSTSFYKPLLDWLKEYSLNPLQLTEVKIKLEYFNTSSSKCLLDIFKILEVIYKAGNEVAINWYYEEEDEDMFEAGDNYQSIIKIPFKMVVFQ